MNRQAEILEVFPDAETILSKSEIIERGQIRYYFNTEKHVGETLSRMVKNGILVRVKKGYYKRGKSTPKHGRPVQQIENQIELFK
ncbi:hypothetical protein QO206_13405 [Leeuwenhoekiella aequorea]|uniref:hypothetical protein n=1 Tax=Leeuwenhoekiella aequorea TaxID=283736 RepID=UPI00352E7742|tara:strand:- start:2472 stop:2726 length:255 start_codon:yes stop_codon:yes gene_type:complete